MAVDEFCSLMRESQAACEERLDPTRRDVLFQPGDEVLLNTIFQPLQSRDNWSPRWMFQI
jgi:hypothetical protein